MGKKIGYLAGTLGVVMFAVDVFTAGLLLCAVSAAGFLYTPKKNSLQE